MNVNECKYDFASDNINIITLVYDESGSMESHQRAMRTANQTFVKDFSTFEEKGSVAISKAVFTDYFSMSEFLPVSKFNTNYTADGGTRLYRAISSAVRHTIEYYNEIIKRLNVRPKITFMIFSDGSDNYNAPSEFLNARQAIAEINSLDATTVFVAFDEATGSGIGEKLGFTCTRDINSVQELISCLGIELSKSCKEQSKSVYSLKSEFFSKAGADSDDDDTSSEDAFDDDFFNV